MYTVCRMSEIGSTGCTQSARSLLSCSMNSKLNRRRFVGFGSCTVLAGVGCALESFQSARARPGEEDAMATRLASVKALTFDVFGTVVDWRSSIIREGEALGKRKGLDVDWGHFADAWRGGYGPSMNRVRRGELPWTNIDGLHRLILNDLLKEFKIEGLPEAVCRPQPRRKPSRSVRFRVPAGHVHAVPHQDQYGSRLILAAGERAGAIPRTLGIPAKVRRSTAYRPGARSQSLS